MEMAKWYINGTLSGIFDNPSKPQSVGITGVAGQLSWLERGIHKPEVGSSILLPATNNISNLQDLINQGVNYGVHGSYF